MGSIVTNSYEPKWHFYVRPTTGDWSSFKYPRFFEITIRSKMYNLEYTIYNTEAIRRGTICSEYRGCRGRKITNPADAQAINIRACDCASKQVTINEARSNNKKKPKLDLRTALLGNNAPTPPECINYPKGLCKNARLGAKCSNLHIHILWSKGIECKLPPNKLFPNECCNGRACLYNHPNIEGGTSEEVKVHPRPRL